MGNSPSKQPDKREGLGTMIIDNASYLCGKTSDVMDDPELETSLLQQAAETMCISSPKHQDRNDPPSPETALNPTSALFARALVSEVTDNPRTMTPAAMVQRERKLLKAQDAARKSTSTTQKPVGSQGQPHVLGSLAEALKGGNVDSTSKRAGGTIAVSPPTSTVVIPPTALHENRAQVITSTPPRRFLEQEQALTTTKHSVTIGLSLSRRHSLGHADTVTRQTAFDFNELQDRHYKFVSSTDSSGWMAGGGEPGGTALVPLDTEEFPGMMPVTPQGHHKLAAPDTVHIPIIQIDAESPAVINRIVTALARGEVFIPHMSILPEALSVNGISPPDLVVRFGCERNEDTPPEDWPNWCLEFMHNQLYDYFKDVGAKWSIRPFQITLAKSVRWKTVKHMNRYFAHAERVIDAWREKGPQYLDPQLSYIDGGATPEEVARPHGIYLLKNGVPTNYFAPNFDPPYTTKMTRSLLLNVLAKSWDKKRREWTSEPVPRLVTPTMLMASMCGCADPTSSGFLASEVTNVHNGDTNCDDIILSSGVSPAVTTDEEMMTMTAGHKQEFPTEEEEEQQDARDDNHQDEEEDSDMPLADITQSKSGTSTRVSSVLLTPYETAVEHQAAMAKRPDPLAALSTTLEDDFSLNDSSSGSDDDDDDESDPVIHSPTLKKDAPGTPPHHASSGGSRSIGGRYGKSPTPEQRFSRARGSSSPSAAEATPSDVEQSATTVPHMNFASAKLMERESQRKLKHEEKMAATDVLLEEASHMLSTETVTPKSSDTNTKKKKKSRSKVKEAYEKERDRMIAMIALAQEETNKAHSPPKSKETPPKNGLRVKDDNVKYTMAATTSPRHGGKGAELPRNDSGSVSLEYSLDSSMYGGGDASTLAGQFISGDGASVGTSGSKRRTEDETDSHASNTTDVPSDEELFAIGWAKAFDPKTGSYYYFTLDRSKIVWDNPLSPDDTHTEASSSIPAA